MSLEHRQNKNIVYIHHGDTEATENRFFSSDGSGIPSIGGRDTRQMKILNPSGEMISSCALCPAGAKVFSPISRFVGLEKKLLIFPSVHLLGALCASSESLSDGTSGW